MLDAMPVQGFTLCAPWAREHRSSRVAKISFSIYGMQWLSVNQLIVNSETTEAHTNPYGISSMVELDTPMEWLVDFACLSQHMHSCLATTCSCGPMSSFLKPLNWPHEVVLVLELSKGFPTVWSPHPHIFYLQLTLSPYVALHVNSTGHHITVSPVPCLIHL